MWQYEPLTQQETRLRKRDLLKESQKIRRSIIRVFHFCFSYWIARVEKTFSAKSNIILMPLLAPIKI